MILVLPYCSKDAAQAHDLLRWIGDLGGCKGHECLLVIDAAVGWDNAVKARDLAAPSFDKVSCVSNPAPVEGWIPGSCSLFRCAAERCAGQPFMWIEPDAVPLKKGWLDDLANAYVTCGKPFMGSLVKHSNPSWPNPYFEGCGIYPSDCWKRMVIIWNPNLSWTRSAATVVVPNAVNTPLIQHLWGTGSNKRIQGEEDNPPTFAETANPEHGILSLQSVSPEAVLWHRCKDGTLIRLLRQKAGIPEPVLDSPKPSAGLLVVFPFCQRDATAFVKTVEWMAELNPHYPNDALLSWDMSTSPGCSTAMRNAVSRCFQNVHCTAYPSARPGEWPPSTAFRHAASYAQKFGKPWLWTEYDMIPLKSKWLEVLQNEYFRAGMPFMAPKVPVKGHYNGTGIYPADTPRRLAKALSHVETAWDTAAKDEMTGKTHDCSRIFQHVWGVHQGKLHPYMGNAPSFVNGYLMAQISPTAFVFHRCKDGTLIDQLRKRKR